MRPSEDWSILQDVDPIRKTLFTDWNGPSGDLPSGPLLAVLEPGPLGHRPGGGGDQVQPGGQRHHGSRDQRPERQQGQYAAQLAHDLLLLGTHPDDRSLTPGLPGARTLARGLARGLALALGARLGGGHRRRSSRQRRGPAPADRAPRGHRRNGGEQPEEHQPLRPERAALPEGVRPSAAQRGGEQPVTEQLVGGPADLRRREGPVHHEEHRQLEQDRQAAGRRGRPAEGCPAERVQREPHEDGEQHDRGSGRGLGQYRLQEPAQQGNKMSEYGHVGPPRGLVERRKTCISA